MRRVLRARKHPTVPKMCFPPRKREVSKAMAKKSYYLRGGPWHGSCIILSSPSTLPINVNGDIGRYIDIGLKEANRLVWRTIV